MSDMDGVDAVAGCCASAEPPSVSASPAMTAAPATSSTPPAAAATATGPAWRTRPRTRCCMERRDETSGPFEGAACAPPDVMAPAPAAATAAAPPAATSGARKRAMPRSYRSSSAGPTSAGSRSSAATSCSMRPRQSRQPSMCTAISSAWCGESAPRTWSGSRSQCAPHAALAG
ncbi:hypothetical protein [Streptomyces malaysiensis]|uniref:hypothetical protein n=1 Tax=Streptomyces sp. HNM0561 TaxID=2903099 RepID=UPI001E320D0A|nr:hypothetical protein [Streptomyces sp. HNM0561]UHH21119.1 hypothetical protein LUV23_35470 [Streptomyces sp. HNM0561]